MPSLPSVTYKMPLGRTIDYRHPAPDRTAVWHERGVFGEVCYHVYRTREAMARAIRKHERYATISDIHLKAVVPLTDGEGF